MIDAADRRTRLLDRLTERWTATPPAGFVCAAGITDTAPAVARLLRCVSEMPRGSVVFAGIEAQAALLNDEQRQLLARKVHDAFAG